ncbi:hypothetical protein AB205_0123630, partial [Aquarana catesbeiana]
MANEARPCPCELGDQFDYKGLGEEVQIEHIKAYVTKPKTTTDKAIIVVQDVYGWELTNTRYFVDLLAEHGYTAVLADFFVGQEPWKTTNDRSTFFAWLETRPADKAFKQVDAVLRYLKEKCHATKIGIIGFCWGGIVTHYVTLNYPELKAGVAFYGLVREEVESLDQKLKENSKVDYKVKVYPKQNHGFAHRKKEEISPEDKPYILEARKDMLDWLKKYFA